MRRGWGLEAGPVLGYGEAAGPRVGAGAGAGHPRASSPGLLLELAECQK